MIAQIVFWFAWHSTDLQFRFWNTFVKATNGTARTLIRFARWLERGSSRGLAGMKSASADQRALRVLLEHAQEEARRR